MRAEMDGALQRSGIPDGLMAGSAVGVGDGAGEDADAVVVDEVVKTERIMAGEMPTPRPRKRTPGHRRPLALQTPTSLLYPAEVMLLHLARRNQTCPVWTSALRLNRRVHGRTRWSLMAQLCRTRSCNARPAEFL